MSITLHPHLIEQATTKGIALDAIAEILAAPALTYGSFHKVNGQRVPYMCNRHNKPQEKWTGEARGLKLCVAVNPCCQTAITVWLDQVETALRPDQLRNGTTAYKGKNGGWRS